MASDTLIDNAKYIVLLVLIVALGSALSLVNITLLIELVKLVIG